MPVFIVVYLKENKQVSWCKKYAKEIDF